jgi:nickel/cobalt exporter
VPVTDLVQAIALRPARPAGRVVQAGIALAAVLAVAAAVAVLVWLFAPAAPPLARNPFGMGLREAAPGAGAFGQLILHYQGLFFLALKRALSALQSDPGAAWSLVGIGFAYGVFHAAGPGHGKAVISSYILSGERALARGIMLSLAAALIQALVAIALVCAVFILAGGTAATMSRTANLVELSGFAVIALIGFAMTWRKAGRLLGRLDPRPGRSADGDCGCDHVHMPGPDVFERASPRTMAAIALGAGIRPCAGAILVLVLALSQHRLAAGIAATLAMALGTALTTSAIAALAVYAKRLALRFAGRGGQRGAILAAGLELAAAAFVLVLGLSLLTGLWSGEGGI